MLFCITSAKERRVVCPVISGATTVEPLNVDMRLSTEIPCEGVHTRFFGRPAHIPRIKMLVRILSRGEGKYKHRNILPEPASLLN